MYNIVDFSYNDVVVHRHLLREILAFVPPCEEPCGCHIPHRDGEILHIEKRKFPWVHGIHRNMEILL